MEFLSQEILIYMLTGTVVGFLAGLLGIGGGLVIVPVLSSVLLIYVGAEAPVVHMAIATSLATIAITSLSSVRAHHQHGAVRWDIFSKLGIGVLIGAFIGGWVSQYFDSRTLAIIFGILEVFIAINMLMAKKPNPSRELPGPMANTLVGVLIGKLSSIVGIGGGTLTTPYLVWNNVSMHQAIATSTAVSLPVAIAGSIGYVLAGMDAHHLPAYSTGYLYWPAFFGIVVMSVLTAPIGAKMAHRLPVKPLKRFFAVFLLILAAKMLFF